jgi:transcription-repair coupling factor (superfamily II helicase)
MQEKQTRNGLRLLLTFEHVKTVNKAIDLLQPLEEKETAKV